MENPKDNSLNWMEKAFELFILFLLICLGLLVELVNFVCGDEERNAEEENGKT